MTTSIPNLIVDTLYYGNSVLLPSVGILSIQRNPSQIMSDGYTITPPYDSLILEDHNSNNYNVDIVHVIADTNNVEYNIAYNCWNEYLDFEAGDNILTVENLAMIDLINGELLAIDPVFALFLSPDNEIQTMQPIVQTNEYVQLQNTTPRQQNTQNFRHNEQHKQPKQPPRNIYKKSKTQQKQTPTLLATVITIGAVLYIAYYFAVKNNII